jgi:hypothetical protein
MAHSMPTSAAGLIWLTPPTSSPGLDGLTPPTSAPGLTGLTPPTSAPGLTGLTTPTSAAGLIWLTPRTSAPGLTGLTPACRDRCSLPRAGDGHAPRRCAREISRLSHANTYTYMLVASEYVCMLVARKTMRNAAHSRRPLARCIAALHCLVHGACSMLHCCNVARCTLHFIRCTRRSVVPRCRAAAVRDRAVPADGADNRSCAPRRPRRHRD